MAHCLWGWMTYLPEEFDKGWKSKMEKEKMEKQKEENEGWKKWNLDRFVRWNEVEDIESEGEFDKEQHKQSTEEKRGNEILKEDEEEKEFAYDPGLGYVSKDSRMLSLSDYVKKEEVVQGEQQLETSNCCVTILKWIFCCGCCCWCCGCCCGCCK
eukprot:TRINITY_DN7689_c0_g1_i1.p1 TRINITY_DN7689_c0_g1~~TRINITY_DN7689_c0_g1_i1.p1  ORF type:complete len:155 (-),score=36.23 TRINITY_DN7689_c0_g1_i1:21-485(-)